MDDNWEKELDIYVQAALEKKAEAVIVLDVRGLTSIADAFIICSGRSNRQVSAIAENIQRSLRKGSIKALSVEGMGDGHWVLMDYGHVIIHVFYESTRVFYDLEGLWVDAPRVNTESLKKHRAIEVSAFDGEEIIID
ncbi:MAG: ribosome silencing factor [Desulfobacteraceae bacterium]|nr:MAG: ribosome silencing factor [Desulfobacteraceae bacterium]